MKKVLATFLLLSSTVSFAQEKPTLAHIGIKKIQVFESKAQKGFVCGTTKGGKALLVAFSALVESVPGINRMTNDFYAYENELEEAKWNNDQFRIGLYQEETDKRKLQTNQAVDWAGGAISGIVESIADIGDALNGGIQDADDTEKDAFLDETSKGYHLTKAMFDRYKEDENPESYTACNRATRLSASEVQKLKELIAARNQQVSRNQASVAINSDSKASSNIGLGTVDRTDVTKTGNR